MTTKAPDAFRTISEVAEDLDLPQHVLRFWETRFTQIKPMKRGGGRRYYRPEDVELLRGIRVLLYAEGFTIRGVQRLLKEKGVDFVSGAGQGRAAGAAAPADPADEADPEVAGESTFAPDLDFAFEPESGQKSGNDPVGEAERLVEGPMRNPDPKSPAPVVPTSIARVSATPALSRNSRREIEAVLADLVEAKRLLDQVR